MDVALTESPDVSDETMFMWNEMFKEKESKGKIEFNAMMEIVRGMGYNPGMIEMQTLESEVGQLVDRIYYFVIMHRVQVILIKRAEILDQEIIRVLDKNHNGSIEMNEMVEAVQKYSNTQRPSDDAIKELFDDIDTDHDGHITREELRTYLQQK